MDGKGKDVKRGGFRLVGVFLFRIVLFSSCFGFGFVCVYFLVL